MFKVEIKFNWNTDDAPFELNGEQVEQLTHLALNEIQKGLVHGCDSGYLHEEIDTLDGYVNMYGEWEAETNHPNF